MCYVLVAFGSPVSLQRVDAHDGQVRLLSGIRAEVEVHHLLHDEIARLDGKHHLREEATHIDPQGHVRDHLVGVKKKRQNNIPGAV